MIRVSSLRLLPTFLLATAAQASPLIYQPVNPSFGGNPLNGSVLLNEATAQNTFTAPKTTPQDRLQAFAQSIQNAILNRVSSAVISQIVNVSGGFVPGVVQTQDFTITVTSASATNPNTVISVLDKTTGQTSTFEIGNTTNPQSP
jgi:curli production assembly/transport component CsgF